MSNDLDAATRAILGAKHGTVVPDIFYARKTAEWEVERAKAGATSAEDRQAIQESVTYLQPTEWLRGRADTLYVLHVRELIERARKREPMRPATDAEIAGALSTLLLQAGAPLNEETRLAYIWVFNRLYPDELVETITADLVRVGDARWASEVEPVVAYFRRVLGNTRKDEW